VTAILARAYRESEKRLFSNLKSEFLSKIDLQNACGMVLDSTEWSTMLCSIHSNCF